MALAIGLVIGFVTGLLFGVALMASLTVASMADDEMERDA